MSRKVTSMSEVTTTLNEARSHLGMHGRPNSATRWYADRHGREYLDASWCDEYVSWVGSRVGLGKKIGEFAYCPSHVNWFKAKGLWGRSPRVGAVVFFDWDRDKVADHIGFVEAVYRDKIVTIEGNTGDAVRRRVRYPSQVLGYGYPPYASSPSQGSSDPYGDTLYRKGSSGTAVRRFQQALIKAGFKLPKYGADGKFGLETEKAVRAFQSKNHLEVDGVIGPNTRKVLLK